MDWDAIGAIGEVVGAVAVLLTLFYFGVQIRKNQQAAIAASISVSHQTELSIEDKLEQCADLVCKANRAEPLTDEEKFRLDRLAMMLGKDAFYKYLQIVGRDGPNENIEKAAYNLAVILHLNPGLRQAWIDFENVLVAKRSGKGDFEVGNRWVELVKAQLELLDR